MKIAVAFFILQNIALIQFVYYSPVDIYAQTGKGHYSSSADVTSLIWRNELEVKKKKTVFALLLHTALFVTSCS